MRFFTVIYECLRGRKPALVNRYRHPSMYVTNAYKDAEYANRIWVDHCGKPLFTSFFYMGHRYVMMDTQTMGVMSIKRDCAEEYDKKFFSKGAYGMLYHFSRDDDGAFAGNTNSDRAHTIGNSPPKYLVLKVNKSFSKDDVERECLNTGQIRIRDEGLVLSKALPIFVEGTNSHVETVMQTISGEYTSFTVMPKYHCDLYEYLRQQKYRNRMRHVGEEGFLQIARVVLKALIKLRAAGYVYADLKLTNILVNPFVLSDTPTCVLGDVGSICDATQCYVAPCTFPSPTSIVTNGRMGVGCVWTFGIFILEYVINLYDAVNLNNVIYREFVSREYASQKQKLAHVAYIRANVQSLRIAVPDDWTTVHRLCEKCFWEESVTVGMCSTKLTDLLRVVDNRCAKNDLNTTLLTASARLAHSDSKHEFDQMSTSI
ncbi:hypothetical protein CYMTET_55188 [Cymbomonas tetramitiformis]|uniref:Protein kinase domain-containing protein n=1 Tax=Cymbomonas tetramitiformis TaxID=36881 RepID=A0AAE0EN37_9CHLO|nr:hypothetical protein CYMTET_55188 [Cymbomonas tetramitiformis]|eukprot:gene104-153_t